MTLGISPKLPLQTDSKVGTYKLNETLHESIKQNFKNLLLTIPGERIMDTRFGVGLPMFLFEQNSGELKSRIASRINKQVKLYMPFLVINEIIFQDSEQDYQVDPNSLEIRIDYSVPALGANDFLDISLWYNYLWKRNFQQMAKKNFPIRYTSRDYNSIKDDLIEYVQRYYSDTFKDFNEASFGALMLDTVSYVGDILSFYLDYQANECFIDTASEYNNVLRLGKQYGYKFNQNQVSYGDISLYVLIPAQLSGVGPNKDYFPIVKKGTTFSSTSGGIFTLNEDIDFSNTSNEIVVAQADSDTGTPTFYAVKTKGKVISGELQEEIITVGAFQKFLRVALASPNVTEIVSVHDTEGNQYFEVDYLTQNIVYRSLSNKTSDKEKVKSILKPYAVARRFVIDQERGRTLLQFGYGSDSEIFNDSVADPSKVMLKIHGKDYITDTSFDPSNLVATDKFGIAPSNTKLRVVYRVNTVDNSNAAANTINIIVSPEIEFPSGKVLTGEDAQTVVDSLEVTNENRIVGDVSPLTLDEIKSRVKGTYAAQNRAVTKEDYMNVIYSMGSEFGSVKRCNIIQDNDSFKRNINIYILNIIFIIIYR